MEEFEVNGYYGTCNATTIYCVTTSRGGTWYAAEGSTNMNLTYDKIEHGVNIESLSDVDFMEAESPIESTQDIINELES